MSRSEEPKDRTSIWMAFAKRALSSRWDACEVQFVNEQGPGQKLVYDPTVWDRIVFATASVCVDVEKVLVERDFVHVGPIDSIVLRAWDDRQGPGSSDYRSFDVWALPTEVGESAA